MKIIKGQDYVMLLEGISDMDSVVIAAGTRLAAVTYWNPSGSTGTLRIGAFVSGAGVNEIQTLTVGTEPTSDGTITVVLDGATGVETEIVDADDLAGVAAKIGAETYPGWDVTVDGADVIFTSQTSGARVGAFTFTDTDTTNAAASFAETEAGVTTVADTSSESLVADQEVDALVLADLTLVENCFAVDTVVVVNIDATVKGSLSFNVQHILGL